MGNVFVHRIGITTTEPSMSDLRRSWLHVNKPLYQFLAVWKAHKLHKKFKFDGIWAMMAHSTGVPATLFKITHPAVPYLLTLQEGDPPRYIERKMFLVWPLFSRAFKRADRIQALSSFLANWARRRKFKGPLDIIPNGTDVESFSNAKAKGIGKTPGEVLLVSTSRLVYKNALDDVIKALPNLPTQVRFINYGHGPEKDKLLALAKKLGVDKRVSLQPHPGVENLPGYLKACDIFIRPSRSEGQGISFIEAMAAGLPVIATQEGGIADFLFDAKLNPDKPTTGWAVRRDCPEDIVKKVEEIVAHPEVVNEVVKTASHLVATKYDWNIIARDMESRVFDKLYC